MLKNSERKNRKLPCFVGELNLETPDYKLQGQNYADVLIRANLMTVKLTKADKIW